MILSIDLALKLMEYLILDDIINIIDYNINNISDVLFDRHYFWKQKLMREYGIKNIIDYISFHNIYKMETLLEFINQKIEILFDHIDIFYEQGNIFMKRINDNMILFDLGKYYHRDDIFSHLIDYYDGYNNVNTKLIQLYNQDLTTPCSIYINNKFNGLIRDIMDKMKLFNINSKIHYSHIDTFIGYSSHLILIIEFRNNSYIEHIDINYDYSVNIDSLYQFEY